MLDLAWDVFSLSVVAAVVLVLLVRVTEGRQSLELKVAAVLTLVAVSLERADVLPGRAALALGVVAIALGIVGRYRARELPPGPLPAAPRA